MASRRPARRRAQRAGVAHGRGFAPGRTGMLGAAAALAGCLLLSACAGSGSPATPAGSAAAPAGQPGAGTTGSSSSTGSSSTGSGGTAPGLTAGLAAAGQDIIYTADISVLAPDVAATARRVIAIARSAGGYVSAENAAYSARPAPGTAGPATTITVKVPVPSYPRVLAQLSARSLGRQLTMRQQTADVTQKAASLTSLVTSQRDAISALDKLLARAGSVSGLLQVRQQISAGQATLNSLLAQQRALNGETAYATVTMTLLPPAAPQARPRQAGHGFLTGLAGGWRALGRTAGWAVTVLGAALPFTAVLIALAAAGWYALRRYRRRRFGRRGPAVPPAAPAG